VNLGLLVAPTLGTTATGSFIVETRRLSCQPTNTVKALKETQSTDSNQEISSTGLILSLSTAGLSKNGANAAGTGRKCMQSSFYLWIENVNNR